MGQTSTRDSHQCKIWEELVANNATSLVHETLTIASILYRYFFKQRDFLQILVIQVAKKQLHHMSVLNL